MLGTSATILGISMTALGACMTARAVITHVTSLADALKGMRPLFNMRAIASVGHARPDWSAVRVGPTFRAAPRATAGIRAMANLATPLE